MTSSDVSNFTSVFFSPATCFHLSIGGRSRLIICSFTTPLFTMNEDAEDRI